MLLPTALVLVAAPSGPPLLSNDVTGHVWTDLNADGLRSPGESGLGGVTVELLDAHGVPLAGVAPTTTDASGDYSFTGLPDGEYRVAFVRPAGTRFTRSSVGPDEVPGAPIGAEAAGDDSDVGVDQGWLEPSRHGPWPTGMRYFEWTRQEADGPWPVNSWIVYPAERVTHAPRPTVRDVYLGDEVDAMNAVATARHVVGSLGANPADLDSVLLDMRAVIDAPVARGKAFPVVVILSGLESGVADVVEIADRFASHGYMAVCFETTGFHTSIALGGRLQQNGGPYVQSDFDHIPQLSGTILDLFIANGYTPRGYLVSHFQQPFANRQAITAAEGSFVLDRVEALNAEPGGVFEGSFDVSRVGYMGFSMGAATAGALVTNESRIDVAINLDSAFNLLAPRPTAWIGNGTGQGSGAPTLHVPFPLDVHGHYFFIPAVRYASPLAPSGYHREKHHELRDTVMTAWMGLWLKGINRYRELLGMEGDLPDFDGYVGPARLRDQTGWLSPAFVVDGTAAVERDAGLVPIRMWAMDAGRLFDVRTEFVDVATPLTAGDVTDRGAISLDGGAAGVVPPTSPLAGLAADREGGLWFVHGDELHRLDAGAVLAGAPPVSLLAGSLPAGFPAVTELAFDPAKGWILGLGGAGGREIMAIDPLDPASSLHIGTLDATVVSPDGLTLDTRGRLWASDTAGGRIVRIEPTTGRVLESVPVNGVGAAELAFHPGVKQVIAVDPTSASIVRFSTSGGSPFAEATLASLGLSSDVTLALEPLDETRRSPWIDVVPPFVGDVLPNLPGVRRPLVLDASLVGAPPSLAGWVLRVRFVDDTGHPSLDRLAIAATSTVTSGALAPLEDLALLISEGRELSWNGVLVGHLETDLGLSVGGDRLLPLTIRLGAAATPGAVEALIEAAVHSGPLGRTFGIDLVDPSGRAGRSTFVVR